MQNNPKWQAELECLAAIIAKVPLDKTIKWGAEVFTYNGKNVVSYGGFKEFFSLWFYNGVFLKDPYKVLIAASEGKQKEYIVYLNEARQEATRLNRLEKIKPMILQGTGLHDRYK